MGIKGDKNTTDANLAVEELARKLNPIGGISSKKMFGGHGLFHDGKMFGMVDSKGNSFLKAGDLNLDDFKAKGATQHSKMPYFSIPEEIIDDSNQLISWANKAIEGSK